MARGPRFWALGVDSGPRGGACEGILDPKNNEKLVFLLVPKRRLGTSQDPARHHRSTGLGNQIVPHQAERTRREARELVHSEALALSGPL